jgi:hypothetical protein
LIFIHFSSLIFVRNWKKKNMIEKYSFGSMTVLDTTYTKDLKIIQGRVVGDWWRKEGHRLTADDIADILGAKPSVIVVGTGAYGAMQVAKSLRAELAELSIELIAEPSPRAVETFNRLVAEGVAVAAGFHLTC